jgi:hypothetical protein
MDHPGPADVHGLPGTPGGLRHAGLEPRVDRDAPSRNAGDLTYTSRAYTKLKPATYLRFRTF